MNRFIYFACILLFFTNCTVQKVANRPFSVVQLTDPQFGFYSGNQGFEKETENYTKAIAVANKIHPDFVIVTGDLVNKPFDEAQISEYKRISGKLSRKIPMYQAAGNHDVGNEPTIESIKKYRQLFGKDYYSIQHKGMYAIVLNSLYLHKPDHVKELAAQQEKWLEEELKKANDKTYKYKIIFLHHPFFLKSADEPEGYFTIPLATRTKYLQLFEKYNVSHVFAGHLHRNAFGKYKGIEMVTSGPVGKPLGEGVSGYRIITFSGNGVTHSYHELE